MVPLLDRKRNQIEHLCRKFGVLRLELFGSAARGDFNDDSDVDFLVELNPSFPGRYSSRYFALLDELEQLLGRKVDLVEIPAVSNPYFLRGISATRTLLYAA